MATLTPSPANTPRRLAALTSFASLTWCLPSHAAYEISKTYSGTSLVRCAEDQASGSVLEFDFNIKSRFKRKIRFQYHAKETCESVIRKRESLLNSFSWGTLSPLITPGVPLSKQQWIPLQFPFPAKIANIPLSLNLYQNLNCIKKGSNICDQRFEQGYLRLKSMTQFTAKLNQELMATYGAEFAAETYHRALIQEPRNQIAIREILQKLTAHTSPRARTSPRTWSSPDGRFEYRPLAIVVSLGLSHPSHPDPTRKDPLLKSFQRMLSKLGNNVYVLRREAYGTVEQNGESIRIQIKNILNRGEDVILVGLSKGVADLIYAMNHWDDPIPPFLVRDPFKNRSLLLRPGPGKILGMANISGLVQGTFLGEMSAPIQNRVMHTLMGFIPKLGEDTIAAFKTLRNIGESKLRPPALQFSKSEASRDRVIVELIGVPRYFGLPPTRRWHNIKIFDYLDSFRVNVGVTDGFIRIPYNSLPDNNRPNIFQIPINAGHGILDGWLEYPDHNEGRAADLGDPLNQDRLLPILIDFILDRYRALFHH